MVPNSPSVSPVGTGREVKRVGIGVPAAAQRQCPQPVDLDLFAIVVPEDTEEIPVLVQRAYFSIAEIADQDVAAEPAKRE